MIPVIFWSAEGSGRCCWDQDVIDQLTPSTHYFHLNQHAPHPEFDGAVVVLPARFNVIDWKLAALNAFIEKFSWVVLMLTSDEESLFPWWRISHPNMRIWVQYAHPKTHKNTSLRYFPIGAPDLSSVKAISVSRPQTGDVWFRGQVNHIRRDQAVATFRDFSPRSLVFPTPGFTLGIDRPLYLDEMSGYKVALCPSGPAHPDSFRCWEALELGLVPFVDAGPIPDPEGRAVTTFPVDKRFWQMVLGEDNLGPEIVDWKNEINIRVAERICNDFPAINNRVFAWYQGYKRNLRRRLLRDIGELGGNYAGPPGSNITVLMPTSPTPNNPDFSHLDITIQSVRDRLPHAEILLMIDGVRDAQEHRRADYSEYSRRVLFAANHHWTNVTPYLFDEHLHQAEMTKRTLAHVDTDYVLFVEHDTPLHGDIPFNEWCDILANEEFDVIRTYHETVMQPEHLHLMDEQHGDYLVTHQWSQRPHLSTKKWYADMLDRYFSPHARTMIEDRIHGPAQEFPDQFHIALYAPSGNMQRSIHLDARDTDPKYEMTW